MIQSTIINDLIEGDLVIADLTEHNPNVMFELGVRIAQEKPVVLMKAEGTGPLFDIDNMLRVFEYNPNLWQTTIEKDLPDLRFHQGCMGKPKPGQDLHEDSSIEGESLDSSTSRKNHTPHEPLSGDSHAPLKKLSL